MPVWMLVSPAACETLREGGREGEGGRRGREREREREGKQTLKQSPLQWNSYSNLENPLLTQTEAGPLVN